MLELIHPKLAGGGRGGDWELLNAVPKTESDTLKPSVQTASFMRDFVSFSLLNSLQLSLTIFIMFCKMYCTMWQHFLSW